MVHKIKSANDLIKQDKELLELYMIIEKWSLFDSRINDIIRSRDINRINVILNVLDSKIDNPMFVPLINEVKTKIKEIV